MIVRKLRLERGWSQETLAQVSGISVRTIQRLERGGNASLESLSALAAVFEVDITTLSTETSMYKQTDISEQERDALEYVRDIKGFYSHLIMYLIFAPAMVVASFFYPAENHWYIWPIVGWGMGVAAHGLSVFEVFSLFGADWERRQVEKRLRRI
ncbi:MAG: 2TM domain-containing protein [Alphaproteobacteria bacterium]|nr:2TM domain-containing protein [Alphaproteobacteria bacterium]